VQVWTSIQRLLHLIDVIAPTYWSLAKPVSHHKRGVSCYRPMLLRSPKGRRDRFQLRGNPTTTGQAARNSASD
jgi:hypothetical protein